MSNKSALVIGSNLAGVRAALDLAQSGIQVYLVEGSPFLGTGMRVRSPRPVAQ